MTIYLFVWRVLNSNLCAVNSLQRARSYSKLTLFEGQNWPTLWKKRSRKQHVRIALLQKYSFPLWTILHFTNPFDNDTLSLPCNLPFGVYLALEVGIITARSFPVKANTWYDWVKICHVRVTLLTKKKKKKSLEWCAEECKNKRCWREVKKNVFVFLQ